MKKIISIFITILIATPVFAATPLEGMPPLLDPNDVYAADRPNQLSPVVKNMPERVYVPNHTSNSISVIDPKTFKVVAT